MNKQKENNKNNIKNEPDSLSSKSHHTFKKLKKGRTRKYFDRCISKITAYR